VAATAEDGEPDHVRAGGTKPAAEAGAPIELMLASGDRLHIPTDAATLRLVLGGAAMNGAVIHLPASVRVTCALRRRHAPKASTACTRWSPARCNGCICRTSVVFANRRKEPRKDPVLGDRDGFAVWAKRLEEGTYAMLVRAEKTNPGVRSRRQELGALLSGIDLSYCQAPEAVRRKSAEAA